MQRVIEGKGLNGVDKNKNEDWSSVWSSLLLHSPSKREHTRTRVFKLVRTHLMHAQLKFKICPEQPVMV